MNALRALWCRLTGQSCSVDIPSSKDLMKEMRTHAVKAERENAAISERRGDIIEGVFFPEPPRDNKERWHAH
jgi:hypothetical protein